MLSILFIDKLLCNILIKPCFVLCCIECACDTCSNNFMFSFVMLLFFYATRLMIFEYGRTITKKKKRLPNHILKLLSVLTSAIEEIITSAHRYMSNKLIRINKK